MRPHRLELQAFGAFPGRVDLDLDALGQNGLLLLCGDTGGGKTTLLDALGFALYGVVPGERAKARDELRSHHAAGADSTWVRLEFSARGRRLRITRTPEQLRPAKRGGGTTKEQPSARLEQWSGGSWEPVAQRLDEVGLEVVRLLGMDAAQFFQVVLLPQGRFAAFLQADHKDREKLLKQLFHVRRFEHVERWLADRAQEAAGLLVEARTRLDTVAARLAQQADVALPDDVESEPSWAPDLVAAAARERDARAAETAHRAAERATADADAASAADTARRQQERRTAEARLAELRAQEPGLAGVTAELEAADRAVPVAVALAAAVERDREQQALRDAEQRDRDGVRAAGGPADAGPADLRAAAGAARTELGRLEALTAVADRAAAAEREAATAEAGADERTARAAAAQARLSGELVAEREQVAGRVEQARLSAAALPAQRAALESASRLHRRAEEAARAEVEATALAAQAAGAAAHAEALAAVARDVRVQRVDAMAAELAAVLGDDDECPVCGSFEHPALAEVRADHVSPEQERQADDASRRARDEAAAQAARAAASAERAAVLRSEAVDAPPDVEALTAEVARLAAAADDAERAEAALRQVEAQERDLRDELLTARLGADEQVRVAARAHAQAAGDRAHLEAALGDDADLDALLERTARLAGACDAAAASAEAAQAGERAADSARGTVEQLAASAGFDAVEQVGAAARDDAWRTAARARLDAHREALAAVHDRLADDDLAVPLVPPAPVEQTRAAAADAARAHEEGVATERLVAERATRLAALLPEWQQACDALPPLREQADELRGLAELAVGRGGNRLSMPLSTFVLAARLEEVAAAASVRLGRMTDGRYRLVHTDTSRDRRSRAGLGLQVEDAWTGRLRDTATLSGGETFMTALSLALGLADVVTAEAGGQTIDALFVDEGFGSLDAGTLDRVMDVLDELRSGGRLVGLVSHVADLRLRIPTQIVVDKGSAGSEVRTTLSAA